MNYALMLCMGMFYGVWAAEAFGLSFPIDENGNVIVPTEFNIPMPPGPAFEYSGRR